MLHVALTYLGEFFSKWKCRIIDYRQNSYKAQYSLHWCVVFCVGEQTHSRSHCFYHIDYFILLFSSTFFLEGGANILGQGGVFSWEMRRGQKKKIWNGGKKSIHILFQLRPKPRKNVHIHIYIWHDLVLCDI